VTAWIMTRPDRLADGDKASLDAILAASPELAAVAASVRAFAVIMNERRGRKLLEPWMTAPWPPARPRSAPSSPACLPTRTPSLPGSASPGGPAPSKATSNRIKMLKRQMYGRASPELLRRRVLLVD
jgi:anti-sigma factor RsiW